MPNAPMGASTAQHIAPEGRVRCHLWGGKKTLLGSSRHSLFHTGMLLSALCTYPLDIRYQPARSALPNNESLTHDFKHPVAG